MFTTVGQSRGLGLRKVHFLDAGQLEQALEMAITAGEVARVKAAASKGPV